MSLDDVVPARGTEMRITCRPRRGLLRRHEFVATVAAVSMDGCEWASMPESVQGRGATVAEAQANFWSKWLMHCIKNQLGNMYLTLEDPNALDR